MRRNYIGGLLGRLAIEEQEENAPVAGEEVVAAAAEGEEGEAVEGEGDAPAPTEEEIQAEGDQAVAEVQIEDSAESLETDLITVAGDVEELADMDSDLEIATDAVEELEVAAEALTDIADNGGLDKAGARVLNLHLQSIYSKVGMESVSNTLAIESFGGTAGRAASTAATVAEIKKKSAELWKAILDMIERSIKFIKEMFARMFDGAVKLKARAGKIIVAGRSLKGEPASKTIAKDSLVAALHVAGKVNAVESARWLADESVKMAHGKTELNIKGAEEMLKVLEGGDTAGLKAMAGEFAKDSGGTNVTSVDGLGIKDPGKGMVIVRSKELPGGRALIGVAPEANNSSPAAAAATRMKLGTFSAAKAPTELVLPVLSGSDIVAIGESVQAIAEAVTTFKGKVGAIDSLKSKIVAEAKKQANAAQAADKTMGGDGKAGISPADARALAKGAVAMLDQPMAALMPYQLNTGKAYLDYCSLSIQAHAAPKATVAETAKKAGAKVGDAAAAAKAKVGAGVDAAKKAASDAAAKFGKKPGEAAA